MRVRRKSVQFYISQLRYGPNSKAEETALTDTLKFHYMRCFSVKHKIVQACVEVTQSMT